MKPYYDDGQITIYCGDSRNVLSTLEAGIVDLVVTSPPYNLGRNTWDMGGEGRRKREQGIGYLSHSDAMTHAEYVAWQQDMLRATARVVRDGGSCFYNHKTRTLKGRLISPLSWLDSDASAWTVRQEIIWDRGSTMNHESSLFWLEDERIYWLTKGTPRLPSHPIGMSTIWRIIPEPATNAHPAPFPVGLASRCIQAVTNSEDVVLDPFMGSGTTLRAAKDLGRRAIGIELEERYCDLAARRLQQQALPLEVSV